MNKYIIACISILILVLVVLPILATFVIKVIPGGVQPSLGNTVKIYDPLSYFQSFVSPENNLTGIGVSIKNPNFANKKTLSVKLLDERDTVIREVSLNGQNIADGKFVKILFEPILDSRGKQFTWSVSSTESLFTDALEIFITDKKPSWSLDLKENDKVVPDGLSYVTLHRPLNSTEVLTTVINGLVHKILGDGIFFAVWVLLIGLVGVLNLPNLRRVIGKDKL